jgi:hypothetical protein
VEKAIEKCGGGPAYYLVLNYYTMTGLASGVRYEWSVFVEDPENGKPRFLVIDALAEGITLDPIQGMNTTGDPVTHIHDVQNSQLISVAQQHDGSGGQLDYFTAIIDWPPTGTPELSSSTRELVTANDFIYWGGGLCDHGMYNGSVHNRNVTIIPPEAYDITDDTPWFEYVYSTDYVCYLNGICDKNYFGEGTLEAPLLSVDPALVNVSTSTPWSAYIGAKPSSVLLRINKQYLVKKPWHNVQPATCNHPLRPVCR